MQRLSGKKRDSAEALLPSTMTTQYASKIDSVYKEITLLLHGENFNGADAQAKDAVAKKILDWVKQYPQLKCRRFVFLPGRGMGGSGGSITSIFLWHSIDVDILEQLLPLYSNDAPALAFKRAVHTCSKLLDKIRSPQKSPMRKETILWILFKWTVLELDSTGLVTFAKALLKNEVLLPMGVLQAVMQALPLPGRRTVFYFHGMFAKGYGAEALGFVAKHVPLESDDMDFTHSKLPGDAKWASLLKQVMPQVRMLKCSMSRWTSSIARSQFVNIVGHSTSLQKLELNCDIDFSVEACRDIQQLFQQKPPTLTEVILRSHLSGERNPIARKSFIRSISKGMQTNRANYPILQKLVLEDVAMDQIYHTINELACFVKRLKVDSEYLRDSVIISDSSELMRPEEVELRRLAECLPRYLSSVTIGFCNGFEPNFSFGGLTEIAVVHPGPRTQRRGYDSILSLGAAAHWRHPNDVTNTLTALMGCGTIKSITCREGLGHGGSFFTFLPVCVAIQRNKSLKFLTIEGVQPRHSNNTAIPTLLLDAVTTHPKLESICIIHQNSIFALDEAPYLDCHNFADYASACKIQYVCSLNEFGIHLIQSSLPINGFVELLVRVASWKHPSKSNNKLCLHPSRVCRWKTDEELMGTQMSQSDGSDCLVDRLTCRVYYELLRKSPSTWCVDAAGR